jgi:1-deoxy-D-xylulose-5-phosphate reductoisomerase
LALNPGRARAFEHGRHRPGQDDVQRITLLGATGSIGRSARQVIAANPGAFAVGAVVGGSDVAALAQVARSLKASFAALADSARHAELVERLAGSGIACGAGESAVLEAAAHDADIVVAGISGVAGLRPTVAALAPGRRIALANKETLVCAGAFFMDEARRIGSPILPLDSEHNAVAQALAGRDLADVARITLTASGGPFRTWSADAIRTARREQALQHPNYAMGAKITVDSAGLMNKGLELIEAHHIFGIAPARLAAVIHPQQIVHGFVSFSDGSVIAGLATPDMRVPFADCLATGPRLASGVAPVDLAEIGSLTFEKPDLLRFPALGLALAALAAGGASTAALNAANEVAVKLFLDGAIAFGQIAELVERTCTSLAPGLGAAPASVADALAIDHMAREAARAEAARHYGVSA